MEQVDEGQAGEPNTPSGDTTTRPDCPLPPGHVMWTPGDRLRECLDRFHGAPGEISVSVAMDPGSGVARISAERFSQLTKFGAEHDDRHVCGELIAAALDLLRSASDGTKRLDGGDDWDLVTKHQDPIRRLEIAGALIAAEIDRRLRAAAATPAAPATAPKLDPAVYAPDGQRYLGESDWGLYPLHDARKRNHAVAHELKTWPANFDDTLAGDKRVEVRIDDRPTGFAADDVLRLQEWVPDHLATDSRPAGYSGRELVAVVTHVTRPQDGADGLRAGHVALSIDLVRGARRWFAQEVVDG